MSNNWTRERKKLANKRNGIEIKKETKTVFFFFKVFNGQHHGPARIQNRDAVIAQKPV